MTVPFEMTEAMERDAAEARETFDGTELTELGLLALQTEGEIAVMAAALKIKQKTLEKIMRYAIPEALMKAGVDEFGFDHPEGRARIMGEIKVLGSLRGAEDQEEALQYLMDSGMPGGVKTQLSVDFTPEEMEMAEKMRDSIQHNNGKYPVLTRSINAQTLMAFGRQKLAEDPDWDYKKVGLTAFPQAKFSKR